jgi:FkbM family methyltransferase
VEVNLTEISNKFGVSPGKVIHAGASYCQERDEYARSKFVPVVWLECITSIFQESQSLLSDYPDQNIYQVTLWSESEVRKDIYISSNRGESSSLLEFKWHKFVHSNVTANSIESHLTSTLDSFIESNDIPGPFALLVLDLQGVELEVLKGAKNTLSESMAVWTEVALLEMYGGQPLFKDIHAFMLSNNFVLVHHDLEANSTMGDALYVTRSHAIKFGLSLLHPPKASKHIYLYMLRFRDFLMRCGIPRSILRNPLRDRSL